MDSRIALPHPVKAALWVGIGLIGLRLLTNAVRGWAAVYVVVGGGLILVMEATDWMLLRR